MLTGSPKRENAGLSRSITSKSSSWAGDKRTGLAALFTSTTWLRDSL
ncbi:hypothetical protein [Vannielia sp.]|nr:hypothetical protein [Vannielia sp.]MDF1872195.1 hypothetical protein [Vannielia sp.]